MMIHLIIHLVDEVEICGPVHARWCYSIERYLGVLTKYMRDKSKPKAGMASGYMIDESLGFCTEYFSLYDHAKSRVWDAEEELKVAGELLLEKPIAKRLSDQKLDFVRDYVIKHSVHTEELLGCVNYDFFILNLLLYYINFYAVFFAHDFSLVFYAEISMVN